MQFGGDYGRVAAGRCGFGSRLKCREGAAKKWWLGWLAVGRAGIGQTSERDERGTGAVRW